MAAELKKDLWRNHEHYPDYTAALALKHVEESARPKPRAGVKSPFDAEDDMPVPRPCGRARPARHQAGRGGAAARERLKQAGSSRQAYLEQAIWLRALVRCLASQIEELEAATVRVSNPSNQMPCGGDQQRLQSIISQIADLRNDLNDRTLELIRTRQDIARAIDTVSDPALKALLELRYIQGLTWQQISDELNYSMRHLTRLHLKALSAITLDGIPALT